MRLRLRGLTLGAMLSSGLLFVCTLAPTLLWGDDAMFQHALAVGELTNHPLWGLLARLFALLPLTDFALKANLISAICAMGAVAVLVQVSLALGASPRAALLSGIALAVSHTFWLQSVRAEVYTLHLLLFLTGLWAILKWRRCPQRWGWLLFGLFVWLIGTINHLLMSMAFLGGVWLIVSGIPSRSYRYLLPALAGLAAMGLLAVAAVPGFFATVIPGSARVVLESFRFSPRWVLAHLALLVYQAPALVLLAVPGVRRLWRSDHQAAIGLLLIAVPTVVFAATHGILEAYVFYLPAYALLALAIGLGSDILSRRWSGARWSLTLLAVLCLHLSIYRLTPAILEHFAPGLIYARDLPGRPANLFFLWPPKRGYTGARWFAETALRLVPANAVLVADWTPYAPLRYLQDVEGIRQDVSIIMPDAPGDLCLRTLRESDGARALFLANADARYYPLSEIERYWQLVPEGPIYALLPRGENP